MSEHIATESIVSLEVPDTKKIGVSEAQDTLTNEQQVYANIVMRSMSDALGLNLEEVRVVIDDSVEPPQAVAIDASPNGQYIGLFSVIQSRRAEQPDWYTIEIAGQKIDPLASCTRGVYLAMIADARKCGERFLPDSLALNQQNGHVWTATMMTGEPLDDEGKILIGSSSSYNKVNFVGQDIHRGGKSFRVRPAVIIGKIDG
jgi:hypothetical protein